MNANELAEIIQHLENAKYVGASKAATMLRQQHAEIEALKMDIHSLTYGERLAKHFNKPVAWIDKNTGKPRMEGFIQTDYDIPLYTHLAKTLTDEEIDYCWSHSHGNTPWMKQKAFARAILRKASEK